MKRRGLEKLEGQASLVERCRQTLGALGVVLKTLLLMPYSQQILRSGRRSMNCTLAKESIGTLQHSTAPPLILYKNSVLDIQASLFTLEPLTNQSHRQRRLKK